jgi:hypothetical protein
LRGIERRKMVDEEQDRPMVIDRVAIIARDKARSARLDGRRNEHGSLRGDSQKEEHKKVEARPGGKGED